jgi:hypothetical protein
MKIQYPRHSPSGGNILILTVVITAIVGFTLASYLTMVKYQNLATMRSQAWNASVPIIEAGIEDALTHLNSHADSGVLATDGWQQYGSLYWIQRALGDAYYVVTISNYSGPTSLAPVIESRGFVKMPTQIASLSHVILATAGSGSSSAGFLARGVRVVAGKSALFVKGMVAKGQIDINGNNVESDSFDSADPLHSTGGQYDSSKRKDNGDVATNSGLINSLSVGNANVYGKVSTGPGGSISIGPNGSVGDAGWHAAGSTGIQPGASTDDMNVDFPDVDPPFTGGAWTPSGGIWGGTSYTYVIGSGNWMMSNLSLNSSKNMIITGNAVLYVTGDISLSGNASIEVAPGASLKLYGGGSSTSLGGNGIINNSGNATNFIYYGLPSNTSLSFTGNGTFNGVIYAPYADFTMNGGGSGSEDFIGASITKSVTMNGHFHFHYDEALSKFGSDGGYVVTSWNEMSPSDVQTLTFL